MKKILRSLSIIAVLLIPRAILAQEVFKPVAEIVYSNTADGFTDVSYRITASKRKLGERGATLVAVTTQIEARVLKYKYRYNGKVYGPDELGLTPFDGVMDSKPGLNIHFELELSYAGKIENKYFGNGTTNHTDPVAEGFNLDNVKISSKNKTPRLAGTPFFNATIHRSIQKYESDKKQKEQQVKGEEEKRLAEKKKAEEKASADKVSKANAEKEVAVTAKTATNVQADKSKQEASRSSTGITDKTQNEKKRIEDEKRALQERGRDEAAEVKRKADEKYAAKTEEFRRKEEANRIDKERQEALVTESVQTLAPIVGELFAPVGEAMDNFLENYVGKAEIPSFTMSIGKKENASFYTMKVFSYSVNIPYAQPTFGFGVNLIAYPDYTFVYDGSAPDGKYDPKNEETMSIGDRLGLNIPFGLQGSIPFLKNEKHNILAVTWELSTAFNLYSSAINGDHRLPTGDTDKDGIKKMTPLIPYINLTGGLEVTFSKTFGMGIALGFTKIPFEESVTGYIQDYKYKYKATAVSKKHFIPIMTFKLFKLNF